MKILAHFIYVLKFSVIGGIAGFVILFFIPNSPIPFNWDEAQKAWTFYQNNSSNSANAVYEIPNPLAITSYSSAVEKAGPSVVSVQAKRKARVRPATDGKEGDVLVDISVSVGSGVIFGRDGYIVTNYHVIAGSYSVAVHFSNGLRKYAKVVGFDQQNDIAVLKVNIETPQVAELGNSSEVKTGDIVMAIGTPFGLFNNSVTLGIISSIDNALAKPRIQTDASINYGNSGGALINTRGQVIGISSAKFSLDRNDEIGINFAAPIDIVKETFNQIKEHGRVVRNWLGASLPPLNRVDHMRLNPGVEYGTGLMVSFVEKGSPSAEAGLQVYDYLTHFDGNKIDNIIQFRKLFYAIPIGKEVDIEILRDRKVIKMKLKLREKI